MAGIKDDNGVRPMAVGEVLRRLVGKCWVQTELIEEACARLLEPRQLRVGTRGGAEAVIRAVSVMVGEQHLETEFALLQIGYRNASNLVSREVFLKEVDAEIPETSRWARWCHKSKSHLWFLDTPPLSQAKEFNRLTP